jgi:ribosomal protein S18 acetylase RimI-like enzyme
MRIDLGFKPDEFESLLRINDACYTGVERPSLFEFTNMLKHTDVFVARVEGDYLFGDLTVDGTIIGFAIVRSSEQSKPYLWSIAVHPAFQDRGVGGNLLREITKRYTLKHETEISLHVHVDNPAQKLYFDYGFRVQAICRGWYNDGNTKANGLFMRKAL